MIDTVLELAKLSPALLYLGAVIYLYRELEKSRKRFEELVERYHTALLEGFAVFKAVQKHLDAED